MRFIFFVLGVPMMIMSFFQIPEALPYVQSENLLVNGHEIVMTEDEQTEFKAQLEKLFENSRVMPALAVVFDNEFKEDIKDGIFVKLQFGEQFEINDLPFEELLFRVTPEAYGFNLFRSNHGIVQGRCIFVDLNGKTTQEFFDYVNSLDAVQEELNEIQNQVANENADEKIAENAENLHQLDEVVDENKSPEVLQPHFENPNI